MRSYFVKDIKLRGNVNLNEDERFEYKTYCIQIHTPSILSISLFYSAYFDFFRQNKFRK